MEGVVHSREGAMHWGGGRSGNIPMSRCSTSLGRCRVDLRTYDISSLAGFSFSPLVAAPWFILDLREICFPASSLGSYKCLPPTPTVLHWLQPEGHCQVPISEASRWGRGHSHTRCWLDCSRGNLFGEQPGNLSTLQFCI